MLLIIRSSFLLIGIFPRCLNLPLFAVLGAELHPDLVHELDLGLSRQLPLLAHPELHLGPLDPRDELLSMLLIQQRFGHPLATFHRDVEGLSPRMQI